MTRTLALALALFAASPVLAAPSVVDVVGRLHFPLLHFPIALLFAVALLEFVVRRGDLIQRRAFIAPLLVTAALSAVVTVGAGLALATGESFTGPEENTFLLHRGLGIATAVVAVLLVGLQRIGAGIYKPLLLVGVVAVTVVGHQGGTLVHGEGYLTRSAKPPVPTTGAPHADDDATTGDDGDLKADARERHPEGSVVEKPEYVAHIKPIFERSCLKCHGAEKRKGGLRLDQKRYAMKGGESGPTAIVPGNAAGSIVYMSCSSAPDDDGVMPPRGKLLALSEIETIKRWLDQGAVWPDVTTTPAMPPTTP